MHTLQTRWHERAQHAHIAYVKHADTRDISV